MSLILQTKNLEKVIKDKQIISNFNLHVKKGEIYGFLGPNGAGKTSVMKMLLNFWKPTNGIIEIFGEKITPTSYDFLKKIGGIIEFPVFYENLSGKENLELHAKYMGYTNYKNIDNVLEILELQDAKEKLVKQYSLGMKQRLGLARAMVAEPEILILDEPTNGLDPVGIKQLRDLFLMLRNDLKTTIMISTHILSEIEDVADTIGIINHGKMVKEISMKEISNIKNSYVDLEVENTNKVVEIFITEFPNIEYKVISDNKLRIISDISSQEITKCLFNKGIDIISIYKKSETLEDYFMNLLRKDE